MQSGEGWRWSPKYDGSIRNLQSIVIVRRWLTSSAKRGYEMSETEQEYANPGDTIEITNKMWDHFGKHFLVVARPPEYPPDNYPEGCAWVSNWESRMAYDSVFIRHEYYKIVSRGKTTTHDTKSVDVSLERQRDDNLRKVFG